MAFWLPDIIKLGIPVKKMRSLSQNALRMASVGTLTKFVRLWLCTVV